MKHVLMLMAVAAVMMVATAMPAFAQGRGGGGTPDECEFGETLDCKGGGGGAAILGMAALAAVTVGT